MHNSYFKLACVSFLVVLGVSAGFGWGSATHAYFADHLGVKFGTLNQNEIYGATLNDLFGYEFTDPEALGMDYLLHTDAKTLWALYGMALSPRGKAVFYGAFTHNNINNPVLRAMRGADWYAHGNYPLPGQEPPDPRGWVIAQGKILVSNPVIANYLVALVGMENLPLFAPVVGHTLIETAVDILVKRCEDPLVGVRLYIASKYRSDDVPVVLRNAFGSKAALAEPKFREQMMGYGQLFMLPEDQLIGLISQQTVELAYSYLSALQIPTNFEITAADIARFLNMAINQVKFAYHRELMVTLCSVRENMENGPPPAGPVFALWKEGATDEELAELNALEEKPTEFILDQNYPNPFNPTTNIAYSVPSDSWVTLKVYNYLGQEIATLVDGNMTAGRYVVTWDARGVAAGTYFCRLQSANTMVTKKMALLK
jgi:hypothetical protein